MRGDAGWYPTDASWRHQNNGRWRADDSNGNWQDRQQYARPDSLRRIEAVFYAIERWDTDGGVSAVTLSLEHAARAMTNSSGKPTTPTRYLCCGGETARWHAVGPAKTRPPFPAPGASLRISFRRFTRLAERTQEKNNRRRATTATSIRNAMAHH